MQFQNQKTKRVLDIVDKMHTSTLLQSLSRRDQKLVIARSIDGIRN